MTVSSQTPINRSTGNGVTTVFPYGFKIISEADIEVTVDGVVKTLNVDYTVSGVGNEAGGNVTMTAAPANLASVVRRRNMALVRTTDYQDQGEMPAETLDNDFDAAVLMIQQVDEQIVRAVTVPAGVTGFNGQLPDPVSSMFLRINSAADGFDLVSEVTPGALTVTPFIETLLNDTDAAAARVTLGAQVAGSYAASGANSDITSLNSPAIGSATSTTQAAGDNSTKVATTAFVRSVGPSYGGIGGFSANTTLTSANYGNFIYVDGTFTLTLPVADAVNIGRTITCYGYAAASVTVATQSSQLLYYQGTNTATSAVMIGVGDTVTFVNYNGTAWMAMGANALGTGQTWQSPGRSGGVTYYNTTGKPIFISVTSASTGSGAGVNITVNGVVAAQVSGSALNNAIASAIVPTGGSYKADMLLGSALAAFTELR